MTAPVDRLGEVLATDTAAFEACVADEAATLKEELAAGTFDNPQSIVGLEQEFYGVDAESGALRRVPHQLVRYVGFEKELGLHNAEMHTSPQPFNVHGVRAQREEVNSRLRAAQNRARIDDIRLVMDGMWTIPPTGEEAGRYLTDAVTEDGLRLGTNLADAVRYHGFSNADLAIGGGFELPHVDVESDVATPASLTTTVQPHYQVPAAEDLPTYFNYALRVAGALLATGVNSPFAPPELYDDGADPEAILEAGWRENRVPVFEDVMNPQDGPDKVRFPRDLETVEAAVDRIVDDPAIVPMELETGTRFDDAFVHLRHKHGSYWRWVRPVFEGATRGEANARIEFRPLPGQPTVRDAIACQAVVAGLLESLPRREHPVTWLPWEVARGNFYAAVRDGLEADIRWITANGDETTDPEVVYGELFDYAVEGLRLRDVPTERARDYVDLLGERAERGTTPAAWKRAQVRRRLRDGASFEEAVHGMQREYVRRQARTLYEGSFLEWLG
jgi:hypothetical protein